MSIDWITVTAQIVNFLVLVWLLKHFLYGPVIEAMQKREQRIQARLDSASQQEQHARDEAERYRDQQQTLDREREEIFADARHEADETRRTLKQEARDEVDGQRRRWLDELERDKEKTLAEISRQVARQVAHATRQALNELADAELEAQAVKVFLRRLHALDKDEQKDLAQALSGKNDAVVASAFDLPKKLRDQIGSAVTGLLGSEAPLRFVQRAELTCGLELAVANRKIGWNIADYLDGLEQDLEAALRPSSGAQ
jgi:F-type H+-transporting ATPase subunit b